MILDFKSDAFEFCRSHGCPPACIIQKAMERGAQLALESVNQRLRVEVAQMKHDREFGITVGGENNGLIGT